MLDEIFFILVREKAGDDTLSTPDRLVCVFAEALYYEYFGVLVQVLHHLRCFSLSRTAVK